MTVPTPTDRRRVARAASALHVPRPTARSILSMPGAIRNDVLAELVRVGPGATLAYLRTQPSLADH